MNKSEMNLQSGHRERMKIKLREHGANALSKEELLEMLLYLVNRRQDVKPSVKKLFARFGTLGQMLNAEDEDLLAVKGVGPSVIDLFRMLQSLYGRLDKGKMKDNDVLSNWDAVLNFCIHRLGHEKIEKFMVIYLNNQNHVIDDEILSTGTIDKAPIFPREIVKNALKYQAAAVIIVHNHPTNNLKPSAQDIAMTKRIKSALETVDIRLHDHLIVGADDTVSFKTMNLI